MQSIPRGVNCTMLVPYTKQNTIDFTALRAMLDWYCQKGCASIFAMCHSTEMHLLHREERLQIIRHTRRFMDERQQKGDAVLPILACGTFSDDLEVCAEQIREIKDAGADVVVIATNRLDPRQEGTSVFLQRGEALLARFPGDFPLGLYECPHPYKRLLQPEELRWAAAQENILFLKDTCCDPDMLQERLAIARGSALQIFNANAQTLLYSLRLGASGYSSVMANIHPDLYVWLCDHFAENPDYAEHLQQMLCFCSFTESLSYPLIAKYVMRREGVPVLLNSRVCTSECFTPYHQMIMDQLMALTHTERERIEGKIW